MSKIMSRDELWFVLSAAVVTTLVSSYGSLCVHQWTGWSWPAIVAVMTPLGLMLGVVVGFFFDLATTKQDSAPPSSEDKEKASENSDDDWQEFEDGIPTAQEKKLALEVAKEIEFGNGHYAAAARIATYRDWLLDDEYDEEGETPSAPPSA